MKINSIIDEKHTKELLIKSINETPYNIDLINSNDKNQNQ